MRSFRVVEVKVVVQSDPRLIDCPVGFQINVLVLDRPPQSFGKYVVHTPASSIHADLYFFIKERLQKLFGGKVRALVRVINFRNSNFQGAF